MWVQTNETERCHEAGGVWRVHDSYDPNINASSYTPPRFALRICGSGFVFATRTRKVQQTQGDFRPLWSTSTCSTASFIYLPFLSSSLLLIYAGGSLVLATAANKSYLISTKVTRKSYGSKVYGLYISRQDQVSSKLIAKLCGLWRIIAYGCTSVI